VATILDPRIKMEYFKRHWPKDWIRRARNQMQQIYDEYRSDDITMTEITVVGSTKTASDPNSFDINEWRFGKPVAKDDELKRYLNEAVLIGREKEFDVIDWWKCHEMEYPTLAKIAFDILAIPCMSVEPERAFSG
jgi:hAT family C-terminal dimerisation region